jgi:predicted transposase YbfD/YdcC
LTGQHRPPTEATLRRVLTRIDPAAVDGLVGGWLSRHRPPATRWRVAAVDGKTLRSSGQLGQQVHLLAALDHTSGAVLAQVRVDGKSNEINAFRPLLEQVDLSATVVTADAMHTQRDHVEFLVTVQHAAYIGVVKRNQPNLYRQLKGLPWRQVPIGDETHDRGHGRYEIRRLQVVSSDRLDFPHAAQAIRITRRVRNQKTKKWRTVTVYAITSLTAVQATPSELADYMRGGPQGAALDLGASVDPGPAGAGRLEACPERMRALAHSAIPTSQRRRPITRTVDPRLRKCQAGKG